MGTTALRRLLKSLCDSSRWTYAVLWKIRHGSPMILTLEDGYFDYPNPRESVGNILDGVSCHDASDVLQLESNSSNGSCTGYEIGYAVADMSHLQYALGDGVVGEVAFTGSHYWFSFNNMFSDEVNPKFVQECPEEWLFQFASGIKTILLVPILPHGVLQLGSLEEVPEDTETVACIRSRFNSLNNIKGNTMPFSLNRDFEAQFPSLLVPNPTEYLNAPSSFAVNPVKSEDSCQSMPHNSIKLDNENLPEALKHESGNRNFSPSVVFPEISSPIESINSFQLEMMESKLFEISCLMEEIQAYSDYNDGTVGVFGESFRGIVNAFPSGDAEAKATEKLANANDNNTSSTLSFPKDCELHKALGSRFWKQNTGKLWETLSLVEDPYYSSSLGLHKYRSSASDPLWISKGDDAKVLSEAEVPNAYSGPDDTFPDRANHLSTSSSRHFMASFQALNKPEALVPVDDGSVPHRQVMSACIAEGTISNATTATLKSVTSTTCDDDLDIPPRKALKMSNVRRRARPADNQRPRPRDRQLIQDRVKELRELVPNGTKCSIDGLLDRTIKHMLYLRNVTDQAEKMTKWVHQEVSERKYRKSCEAGDSGQNGTSWAFEFGSEAPLCPIIVEDLACPGHMLIEMLCNDYGLFMEMAQVIRGLELTILRGVMESRLNSTWAHFIVEACKGFHRLDIFWPLMQLLQRKRNQISSKI